MTFWSLSARRAWIEICLFLLSFTGMAVALRKESVDWNRPSVIRRFGLRRRRSPQGERGLKLFSICMMHLRPLSLSARRAWIEIWKGVKNTYFLLSRSPQGERGLKWNGDALGHNLDRVALRKESVDWNTEHGYILGLCCVVALRKESTRHWKIPVERIAFPSG